MRAFDWFWQSESDENQQIFMFEPDKIPITEARVNLFEHNENSEPYLKMFFFVLKLLYGSAISS